MSRGGRRRPWIWLRKSVGALFIRRLAPSSMKRWVPVRTPCRCRPIAATHAFISDSLNDLTLTCQTCKASRTLHIDWKTKVVTYV